MRPPIRTQSSGMGGACPANSSGSSAMVANACGETMEFVCVCVFCRGVGGGGCSVVCVRERTRKRGFGSVWLCGCSSVCVCVCLCVCVRERERKRERFCERAVPCDAPGKQTKHTHTHTPLWHFRPVSILLLHQNPYHQNHPVLQSHWQCLTWCHVVHLYIYR